MKKVLENLERKLDENEEFTNCQFKKQEQVEYYKINNYQLVEWYYIRKKRTYPGISYLIKNLKKEKEIDLLLRIEIHDRIFVGFCTIKKGKSMGKLLNDNEIKNILENYNSNEKHLDLFDEDEFDKFIYKSCIFIIEYLKNLKQLQSKGV